MSKPGRKPLDANDRSVYVGLTLPSKKFDELCAEATRQGTSLPEVIRRLIYGNTYREKTSKNTSTS